MTKGKKTIALLGDGFSSWGGGIDFLRSCANGLTVANIRDDRIVVVLPDPQNLTLARRAKSFLSPYRRMINELFEGNKPVFGRHKPFSRKQLHDSLENISGEVEVVFYTHGEQISSVLKKNDVDVVIPSAFSLGATSSVPWVGYIHDFQHRYYPEYFSKAEIRVVNSRFAKILQHAKAVIVNSTNVMGDVRKFYPYAKCRVFKLPFSASPIQSWFEPPNYNLVEKYHLPQKYFMISNQFWLHKDHLTAFKALSRLDESLGMGHVHIVCTGKTEDLRNPRYFSQLNKEIGTLGLTNRVHFLGHIPKKDQVDIMKTAIAVLQPTLFEGGPGGGAVYDAVALGVPAILSKISVNMEICSNPNLSYFDSKDAEDLAMKMIRQTQIEREDPDPSVLISEGMARIREFGTSLFEASEFVINN